MNGAGFDLATARKKLTQLRDEAAVRAAGERPSTSLESIEWKRLSIQTRTLLIIFAGIDGDLDSLALRDWHEMPRPEQFQLILSIRRMRGEFMDLVALARHA